MSLTKCRDCGMKVSKKARACPHCGRPVQAEGISAGAGCLIVFILALAAAGYQNYKEDLAEMDQPATTPARDTRTVQPSVNPTTTAPDPRATTQKPERFEIDPLYWKLVRDTQMEQAPDLSDLELKVDAETVTLILTLSRRSGVDGARGIADNCLRQTLTMSNDKPPMSGKQIGRTKFSYSVEVHHDDKVVHIGSKPSGATQIHWSER